MSKEKCCTRKLNSKEAILVVIDMQEKLVPAMSNESELVIAGEKIVKGCRIFDMPIIFTQQYTKGLGSTIEEIKEAAKVIVDDAAADEAAEVAEAEEAASFEFVEKTAFSVVGEPDFVRELKRYEATDIIICGIETHVCLQQSVLDFLEDGYNVFVAADACSSRSEFDYERSLSRMEAAGAVVTTVESILFEILQGATNPKFRDISKLVK